MDVQTLFPGIDKQAPIPLYYQLKQQILRHISEVTLQFGDLLPSEAEICEKLKISRPTVRQAMGDLTAEGYLTRQKGKGTFVARPKIQGGFFQKLQSFEEEMRQRGLVPSTRVLRLALIDGDSRSCDALGIPEGGGVVGGDDQNPIRPTDGQPEPGAQTGGGINEDVVVHGAGGVQKGTDPVGRQIRRQGHGSGKQRQAL